LSNRVAQIIVESAAMKELSSTYDVHYLCASDFMVKMPETAKVVPLAFSTKRWGKYLDMGFWYVSYFWQLRKTGFIPGDLSWSFKVSELAWYSVKLYKLLSTPLIGPLLTFMDRKIIFLKDQNLLKSFRDLQPSLILAPGIAFDSYSHMAIQTARYLDIPSIMFVAHWDFYTRKGPLRMQPEKVLVWGEDMKVQAISQYGLLDSSVAVVGVPQFQCYLESSVVSTERVRKRLGLPISKTILLFCGTNAPFDELSVLKEINDVLLGAAIEDVTIVYRPHPRAYTRKPNNNISVNQLKNIVMDPEREQKGSLSVVTPLKYYTELLSSVDGVITPFSTMLLESALCNKPVFAIGFSDGVHGWNFAEAMEYEHIKSIAGRFWLRECLHRDEIKNKFIEFVLLTKKQQTENVIRDDVKDIVCHDGTTYGERLLNLVNRFMHSQSDGAMAGDQLSGRSRRRSGYSSK